MRAAAALLDLVFPPKCVFCSRPIAGGSAQICEKCFAALPRTGSMCRVSGDFFTVCVAPLYYRDSVRDSLLRFKFSGRRTYAEAYASLMFDCVQSEFGGGFDILSWVPVSRRRLRRRGYDQARLIAEALAGLLSRETVPVLSKVRDAAPQSGMGSAEKRRANISGAYAVPSPELVEGKRILLVDDIITTGATMSECAKTLLLAGADQVMGAAVARSRD